MSTGEPLLPPIQIGNNPNDFHRIRRGFQQMWTNMVEYVGDKINFTNTIESVIGGGKLTSRFVTTSTTATSTDSFIEFKGTTSGITYTLPTGVDGRQFFFYNANSNAVSITAVGGQQIYQTGTSTKVTTYTLSANANLHLVYFNGNWYPV